MMTDNGVAVPEDMVAQLQKEPEVLAMFEAMRSTDQRDFVNWVARPASQSRAARLGELTAHIRQHKPRPVPED